MVARVPHDRLEGAWGLRLGRRRLVIDGARGELDSIPGQDVRGNELGERLQRATLQLGLRPGSHDRSGAAVRGAHVGVSEPGHGDAFDDTPAAPPSLTFRRHPSAAPWPWVSGGPSSRTPLVARSERLKHALDLLPGRRAADQAVLGHPLLDLERRAVLAAVDVHGHAHPKILLMWGTHPRGARPRSGSVDGIALAARRTQRSPQALLPAQPSPSGIA